MLVIGEGAVVEIHGDVMMWRWCERAFWKPRSQPHSGEVENVIWTLDLAIQACEVARAAQVRVSLEIELLFL